MKERGRPWLMQIKDRRGRSVFLGGNEVLVELGDYVYLADITTKRVGPVLQGEKFIALTGTFSKRFDF